MFVVVNKKRFRAVLSIFVILFIVLLVTLCTKPLMRLQYPYKYREYVTASAEKYGLDPLLVLSVIKAESGFAPEASSRKDAKGLMQLTDQTAVWCAEQLKLQDFDLQNIYDERINIELGSYYLSLMLKDYDSDLTMALAAYNAGTGTVQKWLLEAKKETLTIHDVQFGETKKYISKTLSYYNAYQKLWGEDK